MALMSHSKHRLLGLLAAASALPLAGVAHAQQDPDRATVEVVTVTAQKRAQPLQDAPLAVTAITERTLDEMGGSELKDFAAAVPGLELQSNRAGETRTSIRGISEIAGGAPSVGVYVDEIPLSTFTAEGVNLKTFDVERLEILRGPQGTLYGEGSLGGTIRIITNKPNSHDFAARADLTGSQTEGGGFNSEVNLMLNAPLVDGKVGVRATIMRRDSAGWIDNPTLGLKGINDEQSFTGRLSARITPTDRLTVDATYIRQEVKSGGPSSGDSQYRHAAGTVESRDDNFDLGNLTANYRFDFATLTSATGYFKRDSFANNDFTPIAPLLSFLFDTPINSAKITRPNNQEIFTQELRLVSNGEGPLAWTVGAFYKHDNLVIANSAVTNPVVPVSVFELNVDETAKQGAVFGELDYRFTPKLHGVVGLRYFSEDRDTRSSISGLLPLVLSGAAANNLPVSSSVNKTTAKLSVYYQATDQALFYATASSGFRAGGINPNAFLFAGAPTSFGPETLWNYELGAKTTWYDNRLVLNVAAYDIQWDDVIVNAVTANPLFGYSVNAGAAHSRGVELEVVATPVRGLELNFAGNYTEAEIDSVRAIGATPPAAAPGAKLPFVPAYKVHGGVQYTFPVSGSISGRVRLDASHTAKTYSAIDNSAAGINAAYSKVDLRASLLSDRWELAAFVFNLGDVRGELAATSPTESLLIEPRTVGLALRTRW
jgi:iron complex outermembrane receptor protein